MEDSLSDQRLDEELKRHFGYNAFRSYQREIIKALLNQQDVLAILPTGAGKSLCYQLPALMLPGTAIVVSPLISLMQDQVVSLFKNGISAAFINSSLPSREIQMVLAHLSDYKLIYVAPERLVDPLFIECLKETTLSFFVVDEAHCISQWGHSFRPEYRKLSILKEQFPLSPIIALTATATVDVEHDILKQLAIAQAKLVKGSFDRPNLTIRVQSREKSQQQLVEFIEKRKELSGIVYSATRKGVEETYHSLHQAGYSVGRYHAGMPEQERSSSQSAFLHDQSLIMVATVAFGMGVHKPDIRYIVHLDMPKTIEQYYQEIGRAGRDGLPAECLLLYSAQDRMIYRSFIEEEEDSILKEQMKSKIESMHRFCISFKCRRGELLHYFGETAATKTCLACDNCLDEGEEVEASLLAQKILSCVYRLRQNVGIRFVIDVLRGSKSQILVKRGYDQVSTFGICKEISEQELRYSIDALLHLGLLTLSEGEYPVLKWTSLSQKVVQGELPVYFKKKEFKVKKEKKASNEKVSTTLYYNEPLFQALRKLRMEIAQKEKVPPYVVFSDRALQEMALYFPQNKEEFCKINGVGSIKWAKYGEQFLEIIKEH